MMAQETFSNQETNDGSRNLYIIFTGFVDTSVIKAI